MKNLTGKICGSAIEKYAHKGERLKFDFSVEVPSSDEKCEKNDCYYSFITENYKGQKPKTRRTYQIDPIGAFVLGVWGADYIGQFIEPSKNGDGGDFVKRKNWSGHFSGSGYLRDLVDISDTIVDFSVDLVTTRMKSDKAILSFYSNFKLKSRDGKINEEYPIFAMCPMKSFLLAVSLIDARVSYFDRDAEY